MNYYKKLQEVLNLSRSNQGSTTWLLKAAIKNPNVTIVSRYIHKSDEIEMLYRYLLTREPWYKKLLWKWFGRKHPIFGSLESHNAQRGAGFHNRPIAFDNEALFGLSEEYDFGYNLTVVDWEKTAKEVSPKLGGSTRKIILNNYERPITESVRDHNVRCLIEHLKEHPQDTDKGFEILDFLLRQKYDQNGKRFPEFPKPQF